MEGPHPTTHLGPVCDNIKALKVGAVVHRLSGSLQQGSSSLVGGRKQCTWLVCYTVGQTMNLDKTCPNELNDIAERISHSLIQWNCIKNEDSTLL